MKQFNNYIYHKIAVITYDMYEGSVKQLRSKGLPVKYYSHYDFCKSMVIHFKNINRAAVVDEDELSYVNDIVANIITEIDLIYGINNPELGLLIFDYFISGEWGTWVKIVSDTKKYFGV